jgi:hypothetical protein
MAKKKSNSPKALEPIVYQAPTAFVGIFYLVIAAWAVFCVVFLETVFSRMGISVLYGLGMIAFILITMCYFSLAFAYKVEVWEDGRIKLTSIRKTFDAQARDIPYIEGPQLPLGFVRFRLELEKGYLFAVKNDDTLQKALSVIRREHPDIRFKHL